MKKPLPKLRLMPRAHRDIEDCVRFITRQPWGKPQDRERDIYCGIAAAHRWPFRSPVRVYRPRSGISLRRISAAQFVIVYAYIGPSEFAPNGIVSIRAVRHRRVRDVFLGVREPVVAYG